MRAHLCPGSAVDSTNNGHSGMISETPMGRISILLRMNTTQLEFNFPYSYAQQAEDNGLK
jgi:hypothetical protein